jgi:hypothetical protein
MKKEKKPIKSLDSVMGTFDMSALYGSIDEEDPKEYVENIPDKKTVYILVAMHGEMNKEMIRDSEIEVEIYSVEPGKCGLIHGHINTELGRIENYQRIGLRENLEVIEAYKREHLEYRAPMVKELIRMHTNLPTAEQRRVLTTIHPGTSLEKILELYQTSKPLEKRKAVFDTAYTVDETFPLSLASGIYVVATSYGRADLLKPAHFTTDETTAANMLPYFGVPQTDASVASLKKYLEAMKSMNLLHIETMKAFSMKIKGTPDIALPDRFTTARRDEMGSLRYNSMSLSRLLTYFKRLGFEKVVLLDDSCRAGFSIGTPFQSMRSLESTAEGSLDPVVERMPSTDAMSSGGTKRKRKTKTVKRKKSRRFHKKS